MPPVLNEHEYTKCEFSTAACIEQRERACDGTANHEHTIDNLMELHLTIFLNSNI